MSRTDFISTTPAPGCTLLVEARVLQTRLLDVAESVAVDDLPDIDFERVEDVATDSAAMMGRLIEALTEARKAASRYPASSRPSGTTPVPPPAAWQPSHPAPEPSPAKPSRRGVLASAAGLLALGAVQPAAAVVPAAHPDVELLALCEEYTALDRAFNANGYHTGHIPAPAVPDPADDAPATIEQAAALTFAPVGVVMPDRARFMDQALAAFGCIRAGAMMLNMTPDELAAVLKGHGGAGLSLVLDELNETRDWFAGFAKVLDAVEARVFIAASRAAVEMQGAGAVAPVAALPGEA